MVCENAQHYYLRFGLLPVLRRGAGDPERGGRGRGGRRRGVHRLQAAVARSVSLSLSLFLTISQARSLTHKVYLSPKSNTHAGLMNLKLNAYCMSKKSWPISYSNLLNKMGQDLLDV